MCVYACVSARACLCVCVWGGGGERSSGRAGRLCVVEREVF